MDVRLAEQLLDANPMRGGKEHRVALLPMEGRVIKVADVQALATESLFDYLSDLLLSNYYFGDDVQIFGCLTAGDRLHLAITQPYVSGVHPDWPALRHGLTQMGLIDPYPRSEMGAFVIADPILGAVDVFDLHPNNVILDASERLNPIDAHFYFPDRATRIRALRTLGLDQITGLSPLAESLTKSR